MGLPRLDRPGSSQPSFEWKRRCVLGHALVQGLTERLLAGIFPGAVGTGAEMGSHLLPRRRLEAPTPVVEKGQTCVLTVHYGSYLA